MKALHAKVLRAALAVGIFAGAGSAVSSCASIIGIEDRKFEATGDDSGTVTSPLCDEYCETVMAACPEDGPGGENHVSVYPSLAACKTLCAHITPGDPKQKNPTGNTVACRLANAKLAANSGEYKDYCPSAGPGGGLTGGKYSCGNDCESYCKYYNEICPVQVDDCEAKCAVLADDGTFNAIVGANHEGDTLQCRLVHVTNASFDTTHCTHANFASQDYCMDTPSCEHYCKVVTAICSDDLKVYDDEDECLAVCPFLGLGKAFDKVEDTVGCRTYHAYNAFGTNQADAHCPHAGPGGDTHCGASNCEPYCRLLEQGCPDAFTELGGQEGCVTECKKLPGDKESGGTVANSESDGDTVQCRLLEVSRVLAKKSGASCDKATGAAAPCK